MVLEGLCPCVFLVLLLWEVGTGMGITMAVPSRQDEAPHPEPSRENGAVLCFQEKSDEMTHSVLLPFA